jgi:hypothetical protein
MRILRFLRTVSVAVNVSLFAMALARVDSTGADGNDATEGGVDWVDTDGS